MILPLARLANSFVSEKYRGPVASYLELLILQPTPFCNINCDYCYLSNRSVRQTMSLETIRESVRMVLNAGLVGERLSVVWHAGEPLVLSVDYYQEAFAAIEEVVDGKCEISHSFQSNGILIDDDWCAFIRKHSARIGLSIDGPAFLHDLHRKTRTGKPTHAKVMRSVEKLKQHSIPFHAIAVITADALDHADAVFNFFQNLGIAEVGFNIEELEGVHDSSSMSAEVNTDRIRKFWQRLYNLHEASLPSFQIREFRKAAAAVLFSQARLSWQEIAMQNDQVLPFRIISVDYQGHVSTFSPELMGVHDTAYNDFKLGKVGEDDLYAIRESKPFRKMANAVMDGVRKCSRTCEYFSVCGGGGPSNKYFENGSFNSTVTMYCRNSIQLPMQVVLTGFENKLRIIDSADIE